MGTIGTEGGLRGPGASCLPHSPKSRVSREIELSIRVTSGGREPGGENCGRPPLPTAF